MERYSIREYEYLEGHLHMLHREALYFLNRLDDHRKFLFSLFERHGREEQVWSLKKLYSLAMFIPLFLQIGRSYFDEIIYVDTHAGPGLAKVGGGDEDVVLGSPAVAAMWPSMVAEANKRFNKIGDGFDSLFLVERDVRRVEVLKRIAAIGGWRNTNVIHGDANTVLPRMTGRICAASGRKLVLLFVDPPGEIGGQLHYKALSSVLRSGCKVDVVLNVMSGPLARGFASMKRRPLQFKRRLREIFGDEICSIKPPPKICEYAERINEAAELPRDYFVEAYTELLRLHGYRAIYSLRVEYRENNTLYHLLFSSRSPNANRWMGNFIDFLGRRMPESYKKWKTVWFDVAQKGLMKFLVASPY